MNKYPPDATLRAASPRGGKSLGAALRLFDPKVKVVQ